MTKIVYVVMWGWFSSGGTQVAPVRYCLNGTGLTWQPCTEQPAAFPVAEKAAVNFEPHTEVFTSPEKACAFAAERDLARVFSVRNSATEPAQVAPFDCAEPGERSRLKAFLALLFITIGGLGTHYFWPFRRSIRLD